MRSVRVLTTFFRVDGKVRDGLDAISRNEEFINMTLAILPAAE
jgi:hypothetical protein